MEGCCGFVDSRRMCDWCVKRHFRSQEAEASEVSILRTQGLVLPVL